LTALQTFLALLFVPLWAVGQNNPGGTSQAKSNNEHVVFQKLHLQQLLQGKMYDYKYPAVKGHQYWGETIYNEGSVTFEGVTYQDILLNYDIYNNLLATFIVQDGLSKLIILDNSRITNFEINHHMFVNITDSTHTLNPGYYLSAYQGTDIQLLVKTQKTIVGNTGLPGELLRKFFQEDTHILVVKGRQHIIKNKKDVIQAFGDYPELILFIQNERLRFKKNHQMTISLQTVLERL